MSFLMQRLALAQTLDEFVHALRRDARLLELRAFGQAATDIAPLDSTILTLRHGYSTSGASCYGTIVDGQDDSNRKHKGRYS